jgi:hypothetical protein
MGVTLLTCGAEFVRIGACGFALISSGIGPKGLGGAIVGDDSHGMGPENCWSVLTFPLVV